MQGLLILYSLQCMMDGGITGCFGGGIFIIPFKLTVRQCVAGLIDSIFITVHDGWRYHYHIIISFQPLLKGDTQVILQYNLAGLMILEYYAAI